MCKINFYIYFIKFLKIRCYCFKLRFKRFKLRLGAQNRIYWLVQFYLNAFVETLLYWFKMFSAKFCIFTAQIFFLTKISLFCPKQLMWHLVKNRFYLLNRFPFSHFKLLIFRVMTSRLEQQFLNPFDSKNCYWILELTRYRFTFSGLFSFLNNSNSNT